MTGTRNTSRSKQGRKGVLFTRRTRPTSPHRRRQPAQYRQPDTRRSSCSATVADRRCCSSLRIFPSLSMRLGAAGIRRTARATERRERQARLSSPRRRWLDRGSRLMPGPVQVPADDSDSPGVAGKCHYLNRCQERQARLYLRLQLTGAGRIAARGSRPARSRPATRTARVWRVSAAVTCGVLLCCLPFRHSRGRGAGPPLLPGRMSIILLGHKQLGFTCPSSSVSPVPAAPSPTPATRRRPLRFSAGRPARPASRAVEEALRAGVLGRARAYRRRPAPSRHGAAGRRCGVIPPACGLACGASRTHSTGRRAPVACARLLARPAPGSESFRVNPSHFSASRRGVADGEAHRDKGGWREVAQVGGGAGGRSPPSIPARAGCGGVRVAPSRSEPLRVAPSQSIDQPR